MPLRNTLLWLLESLTTNLLTHVWVLIFYRVERSLMKTMHNKRDIANIPSSCNKPWPENISYYVIFTICWRIPLNTIILCLYLCVYFCKLNSVLLLRLFHCRMKDTLLMLALSLSLSLSFSWSFLNHLISKEKWKRWENAVSMSFSYLIWRPDRD